MWDHWGSDCAGDGQAIMGSLIRHNQDNKLGIKAPHRLSCQHNSQTPHSLHSFTPPYNSMLHWMGTGCGLKCCLGQYNDQ